MRPTRLSTYPVLIGRSWLYGTKVTTDWGKKEFMFAKPLVTVPWGPEEHQGETTQHGEEYESDMTTKLESDEDEVYMTNLVSSLTEEEVFGEHVKPTCMIEEVEEKPCISEGGNHFVNISGVKEAIATIGTEESQSGSQSSGGGSSTGGGEL
ncbi:unnamed protein product [Calypogeia fissa]